MEVLFFAGVVYRYYACFPSMRGGFDSLRPHQLSSKFRLACQLFRFALISNLEIHSPMKSLRLFPILAIVLAFGYSVSRAEDPKPAAGTPSKCCAKAAKDGKACDHECCAAAAKEHKNCEKCGGTNEAKK